MKGICESEAKYNYHKPPLKFHPLNVAILYVSIYYLH